MRPRPGGSRRRPNVRNAALSPRHNRRERRAGRGAETASSETRLGPRGVLPGSLARGNTSQLAFPLRLVTSQEDFLETRPDDPGTLNTYPQSNSYSVTLVTLRKLLILQGECVG